MSKHIHGPDCEVERICAVTLENAVNNHEALLAALEKILKLTDHDSIRRLARAAIAAAKETG